MITAGAVSSRWEGLGLIVVVALFAAFALFWIGGQAGARASSIDERLAWLKQERRGWQIATVLSGWQPATTEQLKAVEELADAHGGTAYVRDDGSRSIEVLVRRRLRLRRLWVAPSGASGVTSVTAAGLRPLTLHVRRFERRGEKWLEVKTADPPQGE
jgi:hypothetical protein